MHVGALALLLPSPTGSGGVRGSWRAGGRGVLENKKWWSNVLEKEQQGARGLWTVHLGCPEAISRWGRSTPSNWHALQQLGEAL